jgi:hypothetical protein
MAIWSNPDTGEQFDDGLTARPGEEGFEPQPGMNYMGTPNWAPVVVPEPEADA